MKDGAEKISLDVKVKGIDIAGIGVPLFFSAVVACATALVVAHWCIFGALGH
jgi:hypothetical protein